MRIPDPVNAARARVAYYCRADRRDPVKEAAARREFALVKLERDILETLEFTGPLTTAERTRLIAQLLDNHAVAA